MKDQYDEDESSGESRQSIYYHEVVAPGIDFVHTLTLINTSKLERSAFQLAIELFREEPFVGGKSATGHGEISTNEWYEDLDVPSSYYLDWLKENKDVILEYLDAWERPNKLVRVKKGGEELVWNEPLAKELDRLVQEREADIRSSRGV